MSLREEILSNNYTPKGPEEFLPTKEDFCPGHDRLLVEPMDAARYGFSCAGDSPFGEMIVGFVLNFGPIKHPFGKGSLGVEMDLGDIVCFERAHAIPITWKGGKTEFVVRMADVFLYASNDPCLDY